MEPVPPLPPALPGTRLELDSAAGRLSYYVDGPASDDAQRGAPPLLLIHSINASASAFEVRPLYERERRRRAVYALDLPGFGFSDRSERAYTPRLMTDAVLAMTAEIQRRHGERPIDLLGVSLSCEYAARAAVEQPAGFRSVALVSPTGFNRRKPSTGAPGSTRGIEGLRRLLSNPRWAQALFRQLTRPGVVRYFLEKTWGSKQIDEDLLAYDLLTTRQPGAHRAPLWFLSAHLFSADITRVYEQLTPPVWTVHGVRGDFTDYRYKQAFMGRPNWTITVLPTGALPYFEMPDEFLLEYESFLSEIGEMLRTPTEP